MATSPQSVATLEGAEEAHGIVQTVAAALVALTGIDAVMLFVNRSAMPTSTRLFTIKYGEWLFIPACLLVGWVASGLRQRRFLPLAAAFATAFTALTQFRGSWIWSGTFDEFYYDRLPWVRSGLLGIALAFGLGSLVRRKAPPSWRTSILWLGLLAASLVASVFLPKLWPNDSEFVASRPLMLGACLVALAIVALVSGGAE